jgi:hypothetical protein
MNGSVKCVENQGRKIECMHVKCKYVITIVWNNSTGIKFHLYHLATILWGNFSICFYNNEKVSYNFCGYTIDESVQMSNVVY